MRTVSFSDPEVQNMLNRKFVCATTNTKGDPTAGASIDHAPNDPPGMCIRGNGKQNVQTIFMTPAGEIFHVATGFLPPEDLSTEVRFAHDLFRQLQKEERTLQKPLVSQAHQKRLAQLGFNESEISSRNGFEQFMSMPGFSMQGGTSRNSIAGGNPFAAMIRGQFLSDNKFSIQHPMMDWKSLERDPTSLVGNGNSFFASSSSGNSGRR